MKKFMVILVLGLALLMMSLTLSASAATILDPWSPNGGGGTAEVNLYAIVNHFAGTSFTSSGTGAGGLQATFAPLASGTLSTVAVGGTWIYSLTAGYATFAGFTQDPGTNPAGSASPTFLGAPFPTISGADNFFTLGAPITLTPTTDGSGNFGFADHYTGSSTGTKYTELSLNPGSPFQSNGLIFQVAPNQFIVAFEDGDGTQPLGDKDYNDLVLNVTRTFQPVPLPPSALLMGSGLLGLVGLGWRRRKTNV